MTEKISQMPDPLPKYRHAPLVEVVSSVIFPELQQLKAIHIKGLRDALGGEELFPAYQEQPPIASMSPQMELRLPSFFRHWFESADNSRLVQFQLDRLCYNWRKQGVDGENYPHYQNFMAAFECVYKGAAGYLQEIEGIPLAPELQELIYISLVDLDEDNSSFESVSAYFKEPLWSGVRTKTGLPTAVGANWRFDVEKIGAVGTIDIRTVQLIGDGSKKLRMEIAVKGNAIRSDIEGLRKWCDIAHNWIVTAFDDMLTPLAQEKWGRYFDEHA
jgi:uncharacterized protein (TIGR04255 family)